jgi:hypothetical protein
MFVCITFALALTIGLFFSSTCNSELATLYLRTELQNTFPFPLPASNNCRLTFTHHSEDQNQHSAFSQRRLQQMFPTATPQAKYLLVIKRVTCGNSPSHFPYILPSSERKNRVRKLRKSDIPLLLAKGGTRCLLFLSLVFQKSSAALVPSVYVFMNRVSETFTPHFRLCVTNLHLDLPRYYVFYDYIFLLIV